MKCELPERLPFFVVFCRYMEYFKKSGSKCQDFKSHENFVKKASHQSRCLNGTLTNPKKFGGTFATCTEGYICRAIYIPGFMKT